MPSSRYPRLAVEGSPFIGAAVVLLAAGVYFIGWWTALPLAVLLVLLIALFRDPWRSVPAAPLAILSPADGTVLSITELESGVLERKALRVVLRVDNFGAYTARSPMEGKVLDPRDNLSTVSRALDIAGMWVRSDEGDDVVVLFHGPRRLGSPRAFLRYGERVGQGQRFAFLRLARRAEVFLPTTAAMRVAEGDKVRAGLDALAELRRR